MTPAKALTTLLILLLTLAIFLIPDRFIFDRANQKSYSVDRDLLPELYPYPVKKETTPDIGEISAISAVVIDVKSGITLFEKNSNVKLLPASTTKLMTALVALEKCSPGQVVTVSYVEMEPTSMGLEMGDSLTVRALLYGLLIASGNDAAIALAYSCANSTSDFVRQMNFRARELNLQNTHFTNPAGFDDPGHFTTANDLAKLARVAIANPTLAKIVSTKSTVVTDSSGNKTYFLENINKLLGEVEGIEGIKTGQTEGSLEVLVTQTTRNGNTIIAVVLGSTDRFQDSKQLIEWAFTSHTWISP